MPRASPGPCQQRPSSVHRVVRSSTQALPKAITRLSRFLTNKSSQPPFSSALYAFALGAEVDPFQPNLTQDAAHQLAITFGLTVADVRADAHDVATWHSSDDDLVAAIGARRRLGVQDAATYLRNLRTALGRAR